MNKLQNTLIELKEELSKILAQKKNEMVSYDINAFSFIIRYLDELINEYATGKLKPKNLRYTYITKIIIEIPPSVLDPKTGQRLIEAERKYIDGP